MSKPPKLRQLRAWGETSTPTNGNGSRPASVLDLVEDRKANIARAAFFVGVALLVVLVNHFASGKNASDEDANNLSTLVMNVSTSPKQQLGDQARTSMVFRFGNVGRHSIFYAVNKETNVPFGEIVLRTSDSSEWITPSGVSDHQYAIGGELRGKTVAWIEMPPEGWVEGEFPDVDDFPGDHAYAIFIKPSLDGKVVRIFSNAYQAKGK